MRARVKRNEVRAGSAIRHAAPAQRRPACTRVRRGRTSDDRVEKRVGGPTALVMEVEGDVVRVAGSVTGRCATHARRRPAWVRPRRLGTSIRQAKFKLHVCLLPHI